VPALVLERHRPTLGDLLRRAPLALKAGLALLALVLVAGAAWLVLRRADPPRQVSYIVREPVAFNLRAGDVLVRRPVRGDELLHLERRRGDLFLQSFAVSPLALAPYRGEAGGVLPIAADREIEALARRWSEFELVQEGKTRINEVPGYAIVFQARLGERRLFGREVLLPEPRPGARGGVRLLILATPAAGVSHATEVGVRGVTKTPYRTFRFGVTPP